MFFSVLLQTNGEKQCKFIVDHMQKESKSSFSGVDIVSDFAGNKRFVTGFRAKSHNPTNPNGHPNEWTVKIN